jgi:hypothetical protein
MRCEECGHDLRAIPYGTPCPECGVVTPMERRWPAPMPGGWRLMMLFGWPMLAVMGITVLSLVLAPIIHIDERVGTVVFIVFLVTVLVLVFLLGPLNSARQVHTFMNRMPRRVRAAPLLLLIPRSVMLPVLAGLATFPIMAAIAFGGCLMVVVAADSLTRKQVGPAAVSVVPGAPAAGADAPAPAPPANTP